MALSPLVPSVSFAPVQGISPATEFEGDDDVWPSPPQPLIPYASPQPLILPISPAPGCQSQKRGRTPSPVTTPSPPPKRARSSPSPASKPPWLDVAFINSHDCSPYLAAHDPWPSNKIDALSCAAADAWPAPQCPSASASLCVVAKATSLATAAMSSPVSLGETGRVGDNRHGGRGGGGGACKEGVPSMLAVQVNWGESARRVRRCERPALVQALCESILGALGPLRATGIGSECANMHEELEVRLAPEQMRRLLCMRERVGAVESAVQRHPSVGALLERHNLYIHCRLRSLKRYIKLAVSVLGWDPTCP